MDCGISPWRIFCDSPKDLTLRTFLDAPLPHLRLWRATVADLSRETESRTINEQPAHSSVLMNPQFWAEWWAISISWQTAAWGSDCGQFPWRLVVTIKLLVFDTIVCKNPCPTVVSGILRYSRGVKELRGQINCCSSREMVPAHNSFYSPSVPWNPAIMDERHTDHVADGQRRRTVLTLLTVWNILYVTYPVTMTLIMHIQQFILCGHGLWPRLRDELDLR